MIWETSTAQLRMSLPTGPAVHHKSTPPPYDTPQQPSTSAQQHRMGAAGSKSAGGLSQDGADEGIITVVPAAAAHAGSSSRARGPSPLPPSTPHAGSSSRPSSRLAHGPAAASALANDPLMQHLADLKAQGAKLHPALFAAAPAAAALAAAGISGTAASSRRTSGGTATAAAAGGGGAGGADLAAGDSLLADIAVAQQLSGDTQALSAALAALVSEHRAWHCEHMRALTHNQDYITRTMDQAEIKAERTVRHVQQQTTKLKQLSAGLAKASQLPLLLQQLTAATEALEVQLQLLEQRADAVAVVAAGAGVGTAARAASNSSSSGRTGSFTSWLGVGGSLGLGRQSQQAVEQPPPQQPPQQPGLEPEE